VRVSQRREGGREGGREREVDGGREATSLTDHVRHSSLNASSSMPLFARHGRFAAGSDGAGKEETTTCSGSRTPRAISSLSVSNSIHVPDTGREASVAVFWLRRPESEKARESREREQRERAEREREREREEGRERERAEREGERERAAPIEWPTTTYGTDSLSLGARTGKRASAATLSVL